MHPILAAAALAAAPQAPPPEPQTMEQIEVVTRAPVVGDLQQGVQAYRSEFFTSVRPGTAFDMVQWLPGFTFEDTRDVRGLGGAVGNVLIDGQPPTNKNDTLATVLRRIPASQVDRVDIIVGGAPGIDMRGRTVIANVVLKKTTAAKGALSAASQAYQDGRLAPEVQANISRTNELTALEASFSAARRRIQGIGPGVGTLVRRDPFGAVAFDADSVIDGHVNEVAGSGGYQFPLAGGKLRINGSGRYVGVQADEEATVVGSRSIYSILTGETFHRGEVGVRYERPLGRAGLEVQALERIVARDQQLETRRPPVFTSIDTSETLRESVARGALRFKRDERLSFEGSAEMALNRQDVEAEFRSNGQIVRVPAEDVQIREERGEIGALAAWKPSAKFSLTAGAKVETSTLAATGDIDLTRELTYFKPRVVSSWSPDAKTQVRLRAEREVDQIGFNNFVASVDVGTGQVRAGNPDLRPRRAWVLEAAVERQFWTGASLVVTARRLAIRDVVDRLLLADYGDAQSVGNIGDGEHTDLSATVTLPMKRWGLDGVNLKATLNRRWSEVTDPTTGEPRRLSGQSPYTGELRFSHDIPDWKVTWGVDALYADALTAFHPRSIESIGPWVRVSAFVEYRLRPDLNLRVEGFNLNDPRPTWNVTTYAGRRDIAPELYSERRRLGFGPYLFVRLRKDLG
jgi:hypothetical protein